MRKCKKAAATFLTAVMTAALLSGCVGDGSGSDQNQAQTQAQAQAGGQTQNGGGRRRPGSSFRRRGKAGQHYLDGTYRA